MQYTKKNILFLVRLKKIIKFFFFFIVILSISQAGSRTAFAQVLYSQTDTTASATIPVSGQSWVINILSNNQYLGSGLSGTVNSATVQIHTSAVSFDPDPFQQVSLNLFDCGTDSTCSNIGSESIYYFSSDVLSSSSSGLYNILLLPISGDSLPMTFVPSHYYYMQISYTSSPSMDSISGSSSIIFNQASGGSSLVSSPLQNQWSDSSPLSSFAFSLCDSSSVCSLVPPLPAPTCTDGIQNQDETGIDTGGVCRTATRLSPITPIAYSVLPTNSIPIDFDYYVNSSDSQFDTLEISLCSLSYDVPCTTIEHSVLGYDTVENYSSTVSSSSNHYGLYNYTVRLTNGLPTTICHWYDFDCVSTTHLIKKSFMYSFSLVHKSGEYGIPEAVNNFHFSVSSLTCDITHLNDCMTLAISGLFIPSQGVVTRFQSLSFSDVSPFSYFQAFPALVNELFTPNPNDNITVSAPTPIGTITFFSRQQLLDIPLSAQVRTVIGYLIYFFTALTLYQIVKRIF